MIQPHEIQVGSMIEYNGMVSDIIGITPPKPDKSKRFSDVWVVELGIGVICRLSDIKAIPLTEKILVEWCKDFEHSKEYDKYYKYKHSNIAISFADDKVRIITGNFVCSIAIATNPPLHLLQMLIFALTQQPLKITLP